MERILIEEKLVEVKDYSDNLSVLFKDGYIDSVSLVDIKVLCSNQMKVVYRMIDELQFRGMCTNNEYSFGRLFLPINKSGRIFIVNDCQERYKKINYKKFKMIDLNYKFNIKDDRYFLNVDVNAFKVFNKRLDIEEFIEHLEDIGFTISKLEEEIKVHDNEGVLSIRNVFKEPKFKIFKEFCRKTEIKTVNDVNEDFLKEFYKQSGVGKRKVEDVLHQMILKGFILNPSDIFPDFDVCNIDENISTKNEMLRDNLFIKNVFNDSKYNSFLRFCRSNRLTKVNQIDSAILLEFSKMRGVGASKVRQVKEKIQEVSVDTLEVNDFKVNNNPVYDDSEVGSISSYFADRKFEMFRNFCQRNNVKFVSEIDSSILKRFRHSDGIGLHKYNSVVSVVINAKLENIIECLKKLDDNYSLEDIEEIVGSFDERTRAKLTNLGFKSLKDINENILLKLEKIDSDDGLNYIDFLSKVYVFSDLITNTNLNSQSYNFLVEDVFFELNEDLTRFDLIGTTINQFSNNDWLLLEKAFLRQNGMSDKNFQFELVKRVSLYKRYIGFRNLVINSTTTPEHSSLQINSYAKVSSLVKSNFSLIDLSLSFQSFLEFYEECKNINLEKLWNFNLTFPKLIDDIKLVINDTRGMQILLQRDEGLTLQEIAENLGITRERVRQIQIKFDNKIALHIDSIKDDIFTLFMIKSDSKIIRVDDFVSEYGELGKIIVPYLTRVDGIRISALLEIIYFDEIDIDKLFTEKVSQLGDLFDYNIILNELTYIFSDYIHFFSEEKVYKFLKKDGYKIDNGKITTKNLSFEEEYERVLLQYPNGINLKEYVEDFNLKYKVIYGVDEWEQSHRNIAAIFERSSYAILIDPYTYIHNSYFKITELKKVIVSNILSREISQRPFTNAAVLIDKYKKELNKCGIARKHELYSIIKILFKDKYYFGKRNSMTISKSKNYLTKSSSQLIRDVLRSNSGELSRDKLLDYTGVFPASFDSIIDKDDRLIRIGNMIYLKSKVRGFHSVVHIIEDYIHKKLSSEEFVSINLMYEELSFNQVFFNFVTTHNVNDPRDLSNLIKLINGVSINGAGILVSRSESKIDSIIEHLASKEDVINISDINQALTDLKYSKGTVYQYKQALYNSLDFYRVSFDEFIYKTKLDLSEKTISDLNKLVVDQFKTEYIICESIRGLKNLEPLIPGKKWTYYLVASILVDNGYKYVQRNYNDRTNNKPIIVKGTSKDWTMAEVMYDILKNAEFEDYSFDNIKSFLKFHSIDITEKVFKKEIENFELLELNDFGQVYIRKEVTIC